MSRNAALQLQRILLGSAGNRIDYGNDLARTIRSLGGADPFIGDLYLPADRDAYGRPRMQIPLDPSVPVPYLEGASYDEAARRLGQRFEGPLSEMAERAAFEVKRGGAPIVDGTAQHHAALLQSMGIGAKGNPSLVRQNIMALALLRNPEFREVFERSNVGQVPRRLAALLAARNLNAPGLSIGDLESGRNALEGPRAGLHQFYETADQATQRRLPQGALTQVDLDLKALRGLQGFSANEFGPSIDLVEGTIKGHPASRGVFNALDVRPNATMRSGLPFQDIGGPNVGGTARGIAMDAGQMHADDLTKMERHSPWMATPSQLGPDGLTKAEPRTLLSRIAAALGVRPEQITNDHVREYTRMASAQGIDRAMSRFELPEGTRLDPTGSYLIGRDGRPVGEPRASASGPLRLPGVLTEPRIDVEPLSDRESANFRKLRSIILDDEIGTPEERAAARERSASRLASEGRRVPPPDIGGALDPNRFDQQAVSYMGEESPLENRTDPRAVGRRSWQQVGDQTAASLGEKGRRQLRITVDMAFERAKQLVTSPDQTNRILALEDQIKGSFNALEASLNDPEAKRIPKLQAAFSTMRLVEGTINELTPILGREAAPLRKHLQTAGAMFLEGANAERAGQGRRLADSTPGPEEPSNLAKIKKNTATEKAAGHRKIYSDDGKPPVSVDDPRPMPENRRRGREALSLLQSMGLSDPTEAFGVATSDPTRVPEIEAEFKRNRDSSDLARLPSDSVGRKRFVHKIRILSGILGKDPEVVIREMQATGTKARRVDGELQVTDRGIRKGQPRDLINFRRMMTALGIDVEGLTSGVVGSQYERERASQKLSRQTSDARRLMDTLEDLSDESLSRLSAVAKTRGSGGPKEIRRQLAIELNALQNSKGSGYRKAGVTWAPGVGRDGTVQPTPVMQRDPNAAVRMDASRKNVKSGSATVPVSEFAESSAEKHPNYRQAQLDGATPAQLAELKSKLEERTESKLGGRPREIPKDPVAPPESGGKQGIARGAGSARAIANARTDEVFTRIFGVDRGMGALPDRRPLKRTIQVKELELIRGRSSGDFSANLKALATEAYKRGITIDFSPEAMAVIRRRTPRSRRGNVLRLIQELKDKPQQPAKPTRKQGAPSSRAGQIATIRKMIEAIKNNPDMPDREAKIRLVKKRIAEAQGSSNDSGFKRRIRSYRKKATAAANESRGVIDFGPIEISLQRLNNAIKSVRRVRGR